MHTTYVSLDQTHTSDANDDDPVFQIAANGLFSPRFLHEQGEQGTQPGGRPCGGARVAPRA